MIHGHRPRKRFGQNFLADSHYAQRIVDAVDPKPGDNLVEIGPGLAALTSALIERAGHMSAIEIDRDLAARLRDVHVMLQREVVARMTASPATPDYGRLSVMLQARFRVTRLFTVPAGAFRPAPKVESAVARLVPLRESRPVIADEALFARIVAAAFGQRRKTLRNALSAIVDESVLRSAGIDPGARGETLSVDDYVRLTNAVDSSPLATRA